MKSIACAAAIAMAGIFTNASAADLSKVPSGSYSVDPTHAYVNFQYSHLGLSNPIIGFDDFTIDMDLDVDDPTKTTVSVEIEGKSVITGSDIWYDHLTGGKWFDIASHPTMSFASTGVTANGDGTYNMEGDLTVKGVTKPVTLTVTINGAMMHPRKKSPFVGFSATGDIKRSDWGLGANAPYISDEVTIMVTAEMEGGK